jgi:N-acetylglucosaminyldiphosphoundecaprenol N-acetyl-beta-D-mannosaminyltransferase
VSSQYQDTPLQRRLLPQYFYALARANYSNQIETFVQLRTFMLGVPLRTVSWANLKLFLREHVGSGQHKHIVSINPEILVVARKQTEFARILKSADVHIADGMGIILAGKVTGETVAERVTGVRVVEKILDDFKVKEGERKLHVVFAGGQCQTAKNLAEKYRQRYPRGYCFEAVSDVSSDDPAFLSSIVKLRPDLLFVALGSPKQEMWIDTHKTQLPCVCIGVGGAFDMLAGRIPRAPYIMQKVGLEWFYRLIREPWRWRRQLRLLVFIFIVLQEAIRKRLGR